MLILVTASKTGIVIATIVVLGQVMVLGCLLEAIRSNRKEKTITGSVISRTKGAYCVTIFDYFLKEPPD